MKRIYSEFAYGAGPRSNCWWDETIAAPDWPELRGDCKVDVAVVGGGFTGMSAALHLAESGTSVAVLEAQTPGWGASGRNGGFCCLGGARLSATAMTRQFGASGADSYWQAEKDAVALVDGLIARLNIDVDRHSLGETQLAHNARAMSKLRHKSDRSEDAVLIEAADLADAGLNGPFHGALTTRIGFGLNPRKYLFGLAGRQKKPVERCFGTARLRRLGARNVGMWYGPRRAALFVKKF